MGMIPTGRFVWFEYVSKEDRRAQAFFAELFRWKTKEVPLPQGTYTMITTPAGHAIGGYHQPPRTPVCPYWLSHLQVHSAEDSANKVKMLGGKIVRDAVRIGDMGTMAVVTDPLGSLLALWQPVRVEGSGNYRGTEGSWIWNELYSEDPDRSIQFYRAIGGFDVARSHAPGRYDVLKSGGIGRGGVMKVPGASPMWMPYVKVADPDAIAEKAQALGATIKLEPETLPEVGRVAVVTDPLGASIGVLRPSHLM
ncbi:MAG: VOC family protein [Deltaproteobacteria bacterium]|nr:VOC family protein [Deltaproteobacteria bacterium]MCW5806931.1 VOC family protein [Deltaproteobacteria bacterium]